jgi:hypothetical protein
MQELIHQIEELQALSLSDEENVRFSLRKIVVESELPFTLDDLEVVPTPLLYLCLSGVNGFDIEKGLLSYSILLKLLDLERNAFMTLHKKNTLRELADVIIRIADRKKVDVSAFFSQVA